MEPERRVYRPDQRPDVEVCLDDTWYPAELRSWSPSPSGWWANCCYHRAAGHSSLVTVHEDDVRGDTVDRSYGLD